MDLHKFEEEIAINGPDIEKWSVENRKAAKKLLESSERAKSLLLKERALDDLLGDVKLEELALEEMSDELEANILVEVGADVAQQADNVVKIDGAKHTPLFAGSFNFGGGALAAAIILMVVVSLPNTEPVSDGSAIEYASYEADEKQANAEIDDFLYELLEDDDLDIIELLEML